MPKRKNSTNNAKQERRNRRKELRNKKIRENKEKHKLMTKLPENAHFNEEFQGSIYRFFADEAHADALANGDVFLSTLETCRAYEDAEQGDPEEGHQTYQADDFGGSLKDANFRKRLDEVGIGHMIKGDGNIVFDGIDLTTAIPDAYVLCATTEFSPENFTQVFGNYCVEIKEPKKFFSAITKLLEQREGLEVSMASKVIYADRHFTGTASPNGPIGLVKPVVPYATQKEYRFLWLPKNKANLEPFPLNCPEVRKFCRRIL